jgi:N-methylhydantoinase A/oxoprolinase/acetone carboxylase beta subunit
MRGEGFDASAIDFVVTVRDEHGQPLAEAEGIDRAAALDIPRHVPLLFELRASCGVPKPGLPHEAESGEAAPRAEREVVLRSGRRTIPVYARSAVSAGAFVRGPALVEAGDTTYLVPEASVCRFHPTGSAVISEEA